LFSGPCPLIGFFAHIEGSGQKIRTKNNKQEFQLTPRYFVRQQADPADRSGWPVFGSCLLKDSMNRNPKKEKIVNSEDEMKAVNNEKAKKENNKNNEPLAPVDPRLKKPGEQSFQANEDPLNGVNE
jgi:hypothetical protein